MYPVAMYPQMQTVQQLAYPEAILAVGFRALHAQWMVVLDSVVVLYPTDRFHLGDRTRPLTSRHFVADDIWNGCNRKYLAPT